VDRFLQILFRYEITMQCKFILLAAEQLEEAQAAGDVNPTREQWLNDPKMRPDHYIPRIWFGVQNTIVAAGNLSKLLWGSGGQAEDDRAILRSQLEVEDDSCLRQTELRNHFEHFDEKVSTWRIEEGGEVFIGRNIGGAAEREEWFQHYDPSTGIVTFFGYSTSLPEIVSEARRILPLASTFGG
jgi:hypothetical protein